MQKFKRLLRDLVAIKSISTDPEYKTEISKASNWLLEYTQKSGMESKIIEGFDNPILIAKTPNNPSLKTVLIYGHYDVQPAKKEDGWRSDPFVMSEKNDRFYGRGTSDNKGQILMHLFCVSNLIRENKLGYNIIFMIEGNEETGSPNLKKFIEKYKKELKSDFIVISDGDLGKRNIPALEESFRGVVNIEITVKTANDDMHSGIFGGVILNAAEELAKIIYSFKKLTGEKKIVSPNSKEYEIKRGLKSTIEVTSLVSGYIGHGFRNSIPCKASAKINIRSGPKEDPKLILEKLKKLILNQKTKFVEITFKISEITKGATLDLTNEFAKKAQKILQEVYKSKPIKKHSGGTLPIVNDFEEIFDVPQLMIPLANEDCGMHSASENITLKAIQNGLLFSSRFFSK